MREISYFADALNDVMEARAELAECRSKCEYDADYFCHYQIDRLDKANERLGLTLRDFVMSIMEESK